jgi:hypothetical protein
MLKTPPKPQKEAVKSLTFGRIGGALAPTDRQRKHAYQD